MDGRGVRVRDLESRNGTSVDEVKTVESFLRDGSLVRLGQSVVRVELGGEQVRLPMSERSRLGTLVGRSVVMRTTFALLERAAATDATVLLEGETGTGKEGAADAIHRESARKDGPFVVVDCAAMPPGLLESQLFGHERGAFTGAVDRQIGAFEEASGGTIFLDEIGELGTDLQPKLLRVLERREIRRIGQNRLQPVNVRVVAATHRDLRTAVNAGTFRADLYYRLAVVRIPMPPLRKRLDDLPALVDHMLKQMAADPETSAALRAPEMLERLNGAAWPGDVRELRNYLERCLVFQQPLPLADAGAEATGVARPIWNYAAPACRRPTCPRTNWRNLGEAVLAQHLGGVLAEARRQQGAGGAQGRPPRRWSDHQPARASRCAEP